MEILRRCLCKSEQIATFWGSTRTPIRLVLDSFRLRGAPFVAVTKSGLKLRLHGGAGESFTLYENFIRRDYLRNGITLKKGDTVVDIGANIGAFAILASSIVGLTGRVIAIEPAKETFARLEENVKLNGFGNIICLRAAIDEKPGTIALKVNSKSALSSAYNVNGGVGNVEIVPCYTLSQIFEEYGLQDVHLLKVDCEGSEYGIFESLSQKLADRIIQISMEVHAVNGKSKNSIGDMLDALGFDVRHFPGFPWVAFNKAAAIL